MKRLIGVTAGVILGLAVSAYADEVRPPQRDLLSRPDPIVHVQQVIPPADDVDLLARVVYWEAGNQDDYGKRLVADVILNRVADLSFPGTIHDVVFQSGQFSVASLLYSIDIPEECYQIAREELVDQVDWEVKWFNCGDYLPYGERAFQHGDHFFSK